MAKNSAALTFDLLIDKTLKSETLDMTLSANCPAGAIPESGVHIKYAGGVVIESADLLDRFPLVDKALGRTDDREALLGDEHAIREGFNCLASM